MKQPHLPCEVCITSWDTSQRMCGAKAYIKVNGFPCCSEHFVEFEKEDVLDSVQGLEIHGPGASDPSCLVTQANNSDYYCSRNAGHKGPCAAWPLNGRFP